MIVFRLIAIVLFNQKLYWFWDIMNVECATFILFAVIIVCCFDSVIVFRLIVIVFLSLKF